MNQKIKNLSDAEANAVVRMAWEDRTTFDQIKKRTGLSETEVIKLMRRELKPSSFRLWRKRVSGRITKHRKLFERHIKPSC
ncbi:MAG: TIGR03643 family protein [Puniceicoccaceae bacterium]|mgnify:FL=1|nr:TIGR03643 family protein [Puniceicoccaceae bacterium]